MVHEWIRQGVVVCGTTEISPLAWSALRSTSGSNGTGSDRDRCLSHSRRVHSIKREGTSDRGTTAVPHAVLTDEPVPFCQTRRTIQPGIIAVSPAGIVATIHQQRGAETLNSLENRHPPRSHEFLSGGHAANGNVTELARSAIFMSQIAAPAGSLLQRVNKSSQQE